MEAAFENPSNRLLRPRESPPLAHYGLPGARMPSIRVAGPPQDAKN
jgi:hypothetical protein